MKTLSHPAVMFAMRRQQAADLRADRKPEATELRRVAEQIEAKATNDKPMTLTAGRPALKTPLCLTAGGAVTFY